MTAESMPGTPGQKASGSMGWRDLIAPVTLFLVLAAGMFAAWQIGRHFPLHAGNDEYAILAVGLVLAGVVAALVHGFQRQRAALARSEQRFRDFAEAGSDWFWEMGPDLRFTWMSDNIGQRTGRPAAWYLGKRRGELGNPEDNPAAWAAHLRALEQHQPFQGFVYFLRGEDGSGSWTRTSGKPVFNAEGRFQGYRGASSLCTDEVTALARAHQAEARLHAALSAMADGFALYDSQDRLVLCNDAFRALVVADPACFVIGTPFLAMAQSYAKYLDVAQADPQAWIAERMALHRTPQGPLFRTLPNGRHIRVLERRTLGGGTVMIITDVTELRQREQAVADSEARYALAFRGANEGVWDWDVDSNRIYGSERLWQLIGVDGPAGWRNGSVYTELMHPDDVDAYRERVRAHFRGEAPVYEAEYRLVLPGGQIRWIRSRGLGVKSADGTRFKRMAGSAADITATKEAEFRLRRSETDLKAILDSTPHSFVLLDRERRVRAVNRAGLQAARRIAGVEIVLGADIVATMPPWEHEALAAGFARALDGDTVTREHCTPAPDGTPVWLDVSYTPVRHAGGEIDGVCWIVMDVTARHRAIDALAKSEERFRSLVQNSQDVFGIIDARRVIRYVSDSVQRVLGHQPDMLIGRDGSHLMHADDRAGARKLRELGRTPDGVGSLEVRFQHADGTWRLLELNAVNRLDDPAVRGIIVTARDVTVSRNREAELRAAKEAAEAASRAKSNFLATVSHELRTPLNAIIGFSEIMRDGLFGPLQGRYRSYAGDINQSGTHLLSLINDILDVSKAEAGKLELHETQFELKPALEECLRLVRDRAGDAELELGLKLPEQLPMLHGDERKVKQIVLNLLSNAVKFTNPGGRVDLSVERNPAGELAITVADNGIGIAAEDMPKALTAFGQVDSALSRKYVGTGLGLTLVQVFAKLHDAGFVLDSTPQVGTTVTVTFPPERVLAA